MTTPKVGMKVKCTKTCGCGCGLTKGEVYTILNIYDGIIKVKTKETTTQCRITEDKNYKYNLVLLEGSGQIEFDF